ncbi:potassium channel subfamily K member 3-like [Stylophora pistillata]|uniref:potassium channel subfamily K member 3-like n=1 Tax=Stylophora pistillata TaxID=50429 RepID=UPI000C03B323|nr:potassium channel subfamily K member 3-like [Stylophora pistillata]
MASNSCTRCTFRVVGLLVYVFAGGAIFMQIEKKKGRNSTTQTLEDFLSQWSKMYNLSRENISNLLKDYDETKDNEAKPTWTFLNSVFFVLQLVTTIGYGNITPRTESGQIFTVFYALVGIPLSILALKSIGELVNKALKSLTRPLHQKFHNKNCQECDCDFVETGNTCINFVSCIITLLTTCALSSYLKPEQSFITTFYSIFVTLTTVGFGDSIPFEDRLYVFIITVLPGLCFMSSLIDSIVAYLDKTRKATTHCFSFRKCRLPTNDARITAEVDLKNIQTLENNIDS